MENDEVKFTEWQLRDLVADLANLDMSGVADDDNLFDVGVESISVMKLVSRIRRFGIDVSAEDLADDPTLGGWWQRISGQLAEPSDP